MEVDLFRRSFAEFVGAFALTFVGAGAVMVSGAQGGGLVAIALAHGLVIAVFVSALGHISGGHFNPAVTLGFLVTGRMKLSLGGAYWIAQFGGAALAALLDRWIFPRQIVDVVHLGAPSVTAVGSGAAFVVELILTFFLVLVIFATAADPRGTFKSIAGLAIGLTITLDVLMGGPLTGAAMNPSRAFGPELVQNYWTKAWIWYAGPFLGGAAAALVYDLLYLRPARPIPVGPPETGLDEPRPGETAVS